MIVTTFDPQTALIVVDLQKGIISAPSVHPMMQIVRNAGALAAAFRHHHLPVALVHVAGVAPGRTEQALSHGQRADDWTDLASELNRQQQDHEVIKRTWGAFTNTDLEDYLKSRGVTQVVIAGVATSIGGRVHRASSLWTGIQRDTCSRCNDRSQCRCPHQQRRTYFSETRGDPYNS